MQSWEKNDRVVKAHRESVRTFSRSGWFGKSPNELVKMIGQRGTYIKTRTSRRFGNNQARCMQEEATQPHLFAKPSV